VQTPGLIDIGGITQRVYDDLQAPYWRRQDREQGAAVADPMQLRYTAEPRFVAQMVPRPPTVQPTQAQMQAMRDIPASIPASTYTPSIRTAQGTPQRLPTEMGYGPAPATTNPAVAAIQQATGTVPRGIPVYNRSRDSLSYAAAGRNAVANMPPVTGKTGDGIIDLTASNPSERGAQGIADSQGAPVRVGGKVYYPGGKAPVNAAPQARNAAPTQQRSGGLGGLFGSIFGGNQGAGRSALESGWTVARSSIGNAPDQGKAMVVAPGTASGSVLSGMGFSDGALVPAATVRNLESRGYFK
jgi:hypothetical protein